MPNALTHKYIADTIYDALDETVKARVAPYKNEYHLGSMGPDVIMGLMFGKDEEKKSAGENLHNDHIFESFFHTAEKLIGSDDDAIYAYYLGFLTHYAADSTIHPYVYDYIDNRMKQKFDPILNSCLHTIVETEMDTFVGHYPLKGKNANTIKAFKWSRRGIKTIKKYFLVTNKNEFRLTFTPFDVSLSLFLFKIIMRVCQRHKNGSIRYWICERIDRMLKAEHLLMSALRPRELDSRYDYLNMSKLPYMSIYKCPEHCEVLHYTFPEMLDAARDKGVYLINKAVTHIAGGEKIVLDDFKLTYNGTLNREYEIYYGIGLPEIKKEDANDVIEVEIY